MPTLVLARFVISFILVLLNPFSSKTERADIINKSLFSFFIISDFFSLKDNGSQLKKSWTIGIISELILNFLLIYYVFGVLYIRLSIRICLSIRNKKVTTIYGVGKKNYNNDDHHKKNEHSFSEWGFGKN